MTNWRTKAIECFPELRELVEAEPNPLSLWIKLRDHLACIYREQPLNNSQIGKIYEYAAWCVRQPATADVQTDPSNAVAVAFIEDLPLDKNTSSDLYRWMSIETFTGCEQLFRQTLNDEEFRKFSDNFHNLKKNFSGPSRF